ncbi:hypothetical protein [Endozoicomonas sp. Mp262]|uniref:hypothetical protein n=1 Tax=Endozoicomonas sp. Mp262 TaxID=2919499 RepID=UPI0021D90ED7
MEIMKAIRDASADAQPLYQKNKQLVSSYLKRRYVFYNNQSLNKRMTGSSRFRFKKEDMLFVISFECGALFFDALKEKLEGKGFFISFPYKTKFSVEFRCGYSVLEIFRKIGRDRELKQVLAKVIPGFSLQVDFVEKLLNNFDHYVFFDENDFPCLSPYGHMHMDYLKYDDTINRMEQMCAFFEGQKLEVNRKIKVLELLGVFRDYSVLLQRSDLFVREICSGGGFDWFLPAACEFQNKRSSLGIYLAGCVDRYLPDTPWSFYSICEAIPYKGKVTKVFKENNEARKIKKEKKRWKNTPATVQAKVVAVNTDSAKHLLELSGVGQQDCSGVLPESLLAENFEELPCTKGRSAPDALGQLEDNPIDLAHELKGSASIKEYKESFKESPLPLAQDTLDSLSSDLEILDVTDEGQATESQESENSGDFLAPLPLSLSGLSSDLEKLNVTNEGQAIESEEGSGSFSASLPSSPPTLAKHRKGKHKHLPKRECKAKKANWDRLRNEQQEGIKKSLGRSETITVTQLRTANKKDSSKNANKLAVLKKRKIQFLLFLGTISIFLSTQYADSLPAMVNNFLYVCWGCAKDNAELAAYILPAMSTFFSIMYVNFGKKGKKKEVAKAVLLVSLPFFSIQGSLFAFNQIKEKRDKVMADKARAVFPRYFASYDGYSSYEWGYSDGSKSFIYKNKGRIDLQSLMDHRLTDLLVGFEFDFDRFVKVNDLTNVEQQRVFREKILQLSSYCGFLNDRQIDFGCMANSFYLTCLDEGASLGAFIKILAKEQNISYDHCFYVRVNKIIDFTDSSEGGARYLEFQPCYLKNSKKLCDQACQKAESCLRSNVDIIIPDEFLQGSYRLHRYSRGWWKPTGDSDYYDLKPKEMITMKNIPESGYYAFYNAKDSIKFPPLFLWINKGKVEVFCAPRVLK